MRGSWGRLWAVAAAAVCASCLHVAPSGAGGAAQPPAERLRFEAAGAGGALHVAGLGRYAGAIEVLRTPRGLAVVNEVDFEEYVKGISEMPSSWPLAALEAQAVAARTYALWELRRGGAGAHRAAGADICATQGCQVYTGLAKQRAPLGERWAAAVDATRGQVLWWQGGPIVAKYSSSNGGETVAGGRPYLRAVADPDDAHSPLHRWRVELPSPQVASALGLAGRHLVAVRRVGDVVLVTSKRDAGDEAEAPAETAVPAIEIRERLNAAVPRPAGLPRTVPTARFDVSLVAGGDAVAFDGRGWGHGIGMSQWGAFGKARRGMAAPEILAAYYAGLRPVALPPSELPATIRVALAVGVPRVQVGPSAPGAFVRVVDAATGQVRSHGDTSPWTVHAGRPGLAASPAASEQAPSVPEVLGGTPGPVPVGVARELVVRLPAPAMVSVQLAAVGAAAPVAVTEPRLLPAGEHAVAVPPAPAPGTHAVVVHTDRGGGRTATVTVAFDAVDPSGGASQVAVAAGAPQEGAGRRPTTGRAAATAAALAALLVTAFATFGRLRAAPLH